MGFKQYHKGLSCFVLNYGLQDSDADRTKWLCFSSLSPSFLAAKAIGKKQFLTKVHSNTCQPAGPSARFEQIHVLVPRRY